MGCLKTRGPAESRMTVLVSSVVLCSAFLALQYAWVNSFPVRTGIPAWTGQSAHCMNGHSKTPSTPCQPKTAYFHLINFLCTESGAAGITIHFLFLKGKFMGEGQNYRTTCPRSYYILKYFIINTTVWTSEFESRKSVLNSIPSTIWHPFRHIIDVLERRNQWYLYNCSRN